MKKLILVIEDDLDIQESLVSALELENFDVATAKNGLEGLNYLKSTATKPDAILLDIMMPVMDGKVFRQKQLEVENLKSIPTIVLTADRSFEIPSHLGFFACFKKPVDLDVLLETLSKI